MTQLWTDIAARANLSLSDAQHALLSRYIDLLLQANETMNLTRIVERPKVEVLHIGDSLTLLPFLPKEPHKLVDLGSGGGVPGIPLAIARPDVQVLLVESTKKKAVFLREAAATLGLSNVAVSDERVEEVARGNQREAFDVVTARAVALLPWLVEWGIPLLRKGGKLLAMKGERAAEEVESARRATLLLRAGEPTIHPIDLPGANQHVVVEYERVRRPDIAYPRNPSVAKGKHL